MSIKGIVKYLVFLFILMSALWTHAWSYKHQPLTKYNGVDLYEISLELKKNSLSEMDLTRSGRFLGSSFDQLFINPYKMDDYAVVVFDLIAPASQAVLKLSDGRVVCHAQTSQGRPFAIYFSNQVYTRNIAYCVPPLSTVRANTKMNLLGLLIERASADPLCPHETPNVSQILKKNLSLVVGGTEWILQKMATCVIQAFQAGGGVIEGVGLGITELLESPLEMWDQISEQAVAAKKFVVNLGSEVKNLIQNFSNLDAEFIISTACTTAGKAIVSGVISGGILGVTAKLGISLAKLSLHLKSLSSVLKKINELKAKGRSDLARGVLSCEM